MPRLRSSLLVFWLCWLLACRGVAPPAHEREPDAIVVHAPGAAPLAVLPAAHELVLALAEHVPEGFRIGKTLYRLDWDAARRRLVAADQTSAISVRDGALLWHGQRIELPDAIAMREVWQAVTFHGHVVGLGRTSRSDAEAALTPPFFASELFYFRSGDSEAKLSSTLGAFPPGELGLLLLEASPVVSAP